MHSDGRGLYVGRRHSAAAMNARGAHCNDGVATLGTGSGVMGKGDVGVYIWMVLVRWVQQLTTADVMGMQTYNQWCVVTDVDRWLDTNSLSGSLPTELGLLTGLTYMCAYHAMA